MTDLEFQREYYKAYLRSQNPCKKVLDELSNDELLLAVMATKATSYNEWRETLEGFYNVEEELSDDEKAQANADAVEMFRQQGYEVKTTKVEN